MASAKPKKEQQDDPQKGSNLGGSSDMIRKKALLNLALQEMDHIMNFSPNMSARNKKG